MVTRPCVAAALLTLGCSLATLPGPGSAAGAPSVSPNATPEDASVSERKPRRQQPAKLSIGNATVLEGNTRGPVARFVVRLSKRTTRPVTVRFATSDLGAVAPGDYTSARGKVGFRVGQREKVIRVPVVADSLAEPVETFRVNLSGRRGPARLEKGVGVGSIVDDDVATLTVSVSDTLYGRVLVEPGGATCLPSSSCTAIFPSSTTVTLTAAEENTETDFAGWAGDCAGQAGTVCTLAMTSDRAVIANFSGE